MIPWWWVIPVGLAAMYAGWMLNEACHEIDCQKCKVYKKKEEVT